ncbi:MAG: hypothetical protein QM650_15155 [Microlunatus sp.]
MEADLTEIGAEVAEFLGVSLSEGEPLVETVPPHQVLLARVRSLMAEHSPSYVAR